MARWSVVKWKEEFFLGFILSNFNQRFRKDMSFYILSTDKTILFKNWDFMDISVSCGKSISCIVIVDDKYILPPT